MIWEQAIALYTNNPKLLLGIVAAIGFIIWQFVIVPLREPYCIIRVKEKRGNMYVDHAKAYKGYIQTAVDPESKKKVQWLKIDELNKYWKVPRGMDLTPTTSKTRLVELSWYGGNKFQIIKLSPYIYKKQDNGYYKRLRADSMAMEVLPDDLKLLDYELDNNIDSLTKVEQGFLDKYRKEIVFFMTLLICFGMFYMSMKQVSKELGETRTTVRNMFEKFTGYVQSQTTRQVDDKTTKETDIDKQKGG
jgi:hypothetical protein